MSRIINLLLATVLLAFLVQAKTEYKVVGSNINTTTVTLTLEYTGKDNYYVK
jgi:hypothetical protein